MRLNGDRRRLGLNLGATSWIPAEGRWGGLRDSEGQLADARGGTCTCDRLLFARRYICIGRHVLLLLVCNGENRLSTLLMEPARTTGVAVVSTLLVTQSLSVP